MKTNKNINLNTISFSPFQLYLLFTNNNYKCNSIIYYNKQNKSYYSIKSVKILRGGKTGDCVFCFENKCIALQFNMNNCFCIKPKDNCLFDYISNNIKYFKIEMHKNILYFSITEKGKKIFNFLKIKYLEYLKILNKKNLNIFDTSSALINFYKKQLSMFIKNNTYIIPSHEMIYNYDCVVFKNNRGSYLVDFPVSISKCSITEEKYFNRVLGTNIHFFKLLTDNNFVDILRKMSLEDYHVYVDYSYELQQLKRIIKSIYNIINDKVENNTLIDILLDPKSIAKYQQKFKRDLNIENHLIAKYKNLNEEQIISIYKSLDLNTCVSIIQGPPGTGKTEVISSLINEIHSRNNSCAILSNVHIAIDNVVDRIKSNPNIILKRYTTVNDCLTYRKQKELNMIRYLENQVLFSYIGDYLCNSLDDFEDIYYKTINKSKKSPIEMLVKISGSISKAYNYVYKIQKIINTYYKTNTIQNCSYISQAFEYFIWNDSSYLAMTTNQIYNYVINLEYVKNIKPKFDYIIIDEASKCSLADLVVPLTLCKKVILLGDYFQLDSPVDDFHEFMVTNMYGNNELSESDWIYYNKSLFCQLLDNLNKSNSNILQILNKQYRMNHEIFEIVSNIYSTIPGFQIYDFKNKNKESVYCIQCYGEEIYSKDNDKIKIYNTQEISCVNRIVKDLETINLLSSKSIGIITGYLEQSKMISDNLIEYSSSYNIDIGTIDKFQGREFDYVIISLVRTKHLGFLENIRRLNVALSRAREKIFIIGDFEKIKNIRIKNDSILSNCLENKILPILINNSKNNRYREFIENGKIRVNKEKVNN